MPPSWSTPAHLHQITDSGRGERSAADKAMGRRPNLDS